VAKPDATERLRAGALSATLYAMRRLQQLRVLALDCQASGASPAHGDLLSLAWAISGPHGVEGAPRSDWIVPRSERRISRAVRELTGFRESYLATALREEHAFRILCEAGASLAADEGRSTAPTVIHFARFELAFLRDLHARLSPERPFPLEVVCLHEIATRLLPELPRRNIRALAGHLGHSLELLRDANGHALATAFIWRALVPMLAERSLSRWDELTAWLATSARPARPARRSYPLSAERRRALPDRPGVYRFVRRNGDVLYVGKASSLKTRVASHFAGHARANERSLEMLTQVFDIDYSETASVLEAALLESDEIKRIDPPYNIQLRTSDRSTWFAARDLRDVVAAPDPEHVLGPLPSRFSVAALGALVALAEGAEPTPQNRALTLGVPAAFAPNEALFREGLALFMAEQLAPCAGGSWQRVVDRAARALWRLRGRSEPEPSAAEEAPPDVWDLARVRRRLERNLVQGGLILRRARYLRLLANADVCYRERAMEHARSLILVDGAIAARSTVANGEGFRETPIRRPRPRQSVREKLDIAAYDRLRVLATELRRVHDDGGEVALRFATHVFSAERFAHLTREV
jgi:DNA polymerase III epsilon subunit-like protein